MLPVKRVCRRCNRIFREWGLHNFSKYELTCNPCSFGEINGKSEMRKLQKKLYRIRKMG